MEDFTNIHMECTECGGNMVLDEDRIMLVCPYCGNHEALDSITASRLNAQDDKVAAFAQMKANREAQRAAAERHARVAGRVGKIIGIVIAVFVALCVLGVAINVVEDIRYEAERRNSMNQTYTWPTVGLAQMIPQPEQTTGEIMSFGDSFEIEVPVTSEDDVNRYMERVKEAGFTIDPVAGSGSYNAYNSEGYYVSVYYWKYSDTKTMEVRLEAPLDAKPITLPSTGVGALLPTPPSTMGAIQYDNGTSFRMTLADVSREAFASYSETCISAGFNVNYNRKDDYFYGSDSQGNSLRLDYKGNNLMDVSIYAKSS